MTAESMQDSTVPVGDKSMTFEVRVIFFPTSFHLN